ncbi:hypothetical protein LuPra_05445 [Luteitalea pratensis]|uniref:Uncharacterized protein n=1 Tax=Luteitalea pratensis TaxID=1855912 RepID=A0A143PUB5_LUTPR|nr:hypothetical protein [Luteitalea pratensis]AMY12172.1 hypothetical protein LuPra_05445 [Luteitalea pratensis]
MRDIATVAALAVLVSGEPLTAAASDDPKAVAYEALSSLLLGNAAAFANVTLPVDGVQAILRPSPPSGDERARIDEQLARVKLSTRLPPLFEGEPVDDGKAPPVGTRIVYRTQLGGSLVPVVEVRSTAGWRVDPRYWVAERLQQDANLQDATPPMIVKRFMFHIMNRDTDELKA